MAEEVLLTRSSGVWKIIGHRGQTDVGIKHLYHGNYKNISALLLKQGRQRWAGPAVGCTLGPCGPLQSPRGVGGDLSGQSAQMRLLGESCAAKLRAGMKLPRVQVSSILSLERGGKGSDASMVPGAGVASSKISSQYLQKTVAALWLAVISAVIKGLTFSHDIWCPRHTLVRKLFIS